MGRSSSSKVWQAFTVVELLVVLAIIAILVLVLLPPIRHARGPAFTVYCMNSLKQVGIAAATWAADNTNRLPAQVSVTNGGSMEFISAGSLTPHFRVLSNELSAPKFLCCPADTKKSSATNFATLIDQNISYFLNVDAAPFMTNSIFAGDRNLQSVGQPLAPGLRTITTNVSLGWTRELHAVSASSLRGNFLFTDAHVLSVRARDLNAAFQRQGLATARLAMP